MSELKEFRLPDVGEGLTEAEIVRWHVQPGDEVKINQIIVEIETAKAVVELPSPYAGVVSDLLVAEGATADVGTPIIAVQVGGGAPGPRPGSTADAAAASSTAASPAAASPAAASPAAASTVAASPAETTAGNAAALAEDLVPSPPAEGGVEPGIHGSLAPKQERQAVLVGYGVKLGATTRRARKPPADRGGAAADTGAANGSAGRPDRASQAHVLAKPPVRKLAKDLGVDLAGLAGTGPNGSITRDDVQTAASRPAGGPAGAPADAGAPGQAAAPAPRQDASQAGRARPARVMAGPREERIAVRGIRKHTAAAMVASAFTAPHVTEFLQVDVTETMAAVARLKTLPEFAGLRVSPLLLVARALLVAVGRHPMINSSWDEENQEIVLKNYVNLGIAAATERGLVVPNIKDAHLLGLPELGQALGDLAETARAGRASVADLRGGTITITNVGVFGVDAGTPILTPGETAILAFGQIKDAPWVHEGQLAIRKVTTLSLAFDHRVVDGELGSAALRDVAAMLEDPLRMLAWS
jgi:2-oxoisovalerate dehydrogenase E2 component (dihydrolipoyl transacylase)